MVPVLVLEWTVKVERVVGNNVFFSSEGKAGRFVFVKGTSQNFFVGTFLKVGIEMVSEPPPLSFSTRGKTVVYGTVRDLVVNGLVISKWNPKTEWSWLKETFKWEEVLVIIDEGMLDKPHFDTGDCVRIKIEKTKGFTTVGEPRTSYS